MIHRFQRHERPFLHYVDDAFLLESTIREINEAWPAHDDERWHHERRDYATKSAMMFPRELPPPAQHVAAMLYGSDACKTLGELLGIEGLLPDPWFSTGPLMPRVGGGLHEITRGGRLGIHTDFDGHPTGLTRCANLLIYLNEDWQDEWNGELELHAKGEMKAIAPRAGTAVLFETDGKSWHGHPEPLACPDNRSRRSLALYYYRQPTGPHERTTTLYRAAP